MTAAYDTREESAPLDVFNAARRHFERLVSDLRQAPEVFALDGDGLQQRLHREGRELQRLLLQAHFDLRAPAQVVDPVRDDQGRERTYTRMTGRGVISRFGHVRLHRISYCREGLSRLSPLDADLNLSKKKVSRHVAKLICEHARDQSFEKAQAKLKDLTGLVIGNRQLEGLCVDVAQDFVSFYEERQVPKAPCAAKQLILTCDGKGVAMIERDLRPETRKRARAQREAGSGRKRRLASGEKRDKKRMAMVAAVYDHEAWPRTAEEIVRGSLVGSKRSRPVHKRVWADLERSTREVVSDLFAEAKRRDAEGARQWAVLIDGDPHQMEAVITHVEALRACGFRIFVILDLIHVAEYLWTSANALFGATSDERDAWVHHQLLRLLRGEARGVVHGLRVSAGRRKLSGSRLEAVRKSALYLEKRLKFLRYDAAIEGGLPIATGVIEGTCRHLVNDRLGITGARWSLATAQAILRLRALHASGDWDAYWRWHKQKSFERDHATRYAQHIPPKPVYTALRNHLSLVE